MAWATAARTLNTGLTSQEPFVAGWTTASFTPTPDSLLVISVGLAHDGNSAGTDSDELISISDSESLTWTKRAGEQYVTGAWGGVHAVFTAPVGGSPSSMTIDIDIDSAAGVDYFGGWNVYDVTGHDVTTPIAAANPPNTSSSRKAGGDS